MTIGVTLDAGGLIALDRDDRRVIVLLARAAETRGRVTVPASALAQQVSPQQFLQLIADPHRWRLVRELALSDRRVGELTQLVGEPQNLVSYHLRELRHAGLVSSRRSSFDGRDAYYRVELDRCRDLLCAAGAA